MDQEYADAGLPAPSTHQGTQGLSLRPICGGDHRLRESQGERRAKTLPGWTHERERNLSVAGDAIKAMAYQAVGQKTQAGETFRAAAEFADAEFPAMDGGNMGGDWKDMLAARTLLKEVQTGIGVSAGPR